LSWVALRQYWVEAARQRQEIGRKEGAPVGGKARHSIDVSLSPKKGGKADCSGQVNRHWRRAERRGCDHSQSAQLLIHTMPAAGKQRLR
jgi:hypothetical protein